MEYTPVSKYVKIIGRTLEKNGILWLVQSGAAISFIVKGKYAAVTFAGDDSIENNRDFRSRYAVMVDGKIIIDDVISLRKKEIILFDKKVTQTSEVKIIHLSEAVRGAVGVENILVKSDDGNFVMPAEKKKLSIEFIGDSITCAYGVEGKDSSEPFKTTTENFMKSYAYLTAEKLDADYSAVSYSGHGVMSGYTSDGKMNEKDIVPPFYGKIGKTPEYALEWDFKSHKNDIIVINLGTNDSNYVNQNRMQRSVEFKKAYVKFLKDVREKNTDAYIFCTVGLMGGGMYQYVSEAVVDYRIETGDKRITSFELEMQKLSDGVGSDWHPSEITQRKAADAVAKRIIKVLEN